MLDIVSFQASIIYAAMPLMLTHYRALAQEAHKIPSMEEAQNKARENKAKEAVAHAQERIQVGCLCQADSV